MSLRRRSAARRLLRAGGLAVIASAIALGSLAWASRPSGDSGIVLLAGSGTAGGPGAQNTGAAPGTPFTITGKVSGLYPGAVKPLVLTVANHESFAIIVLSLKTTAGAAKTGCGAVNLTVTSFSGQLHVAAGKTAHVTVHAKMAHSAPNACQKAVFPLRYSGQAKKAG